MPRFYLHVNSHVIRANRRQGKAARKPTVMRVGKTGRSQPGWGFLIVDAAGRPVAAIRYTPDRPLKCGAEVYVECLHRPVPDPQAKAPPAAAASPTQSTCRVGRSTGKAP